MEAQTTMIAWLSQQVRERQSLASFFFADRLHLFLSANGAPVASCKFGQHCTVLNRIAKIPAEGVQADLMSDDDVVLAGLCFARVFQESFR